MPRVQNSSILATVFPTEVDIILLRARPATFDYNYRNVRKKKWKRKRKQRWRFDDFELTRRDRRPTRWSRRSLGLRCLTPSRRERVPAWSETNGTPTLSFDCLCDNSFNFQKQDSRFFFFDVVRKCIRRYSKDTRIVDYRTLDWQFNNTQLYQTRI